MKPKRIRTKVSCGVICCRVNKGKLEALFIRKRNTYSFIDFVMRISGRPDPDHLARLFNNMTAEEKVDIASLDFDRIWYRIWLECPPERKNLRETYERRKKYFTRHFLADGGRALRWRLGTSRSADTLWDLPKGGQFFEETPLNCAIRELEEETGMKPKDYFLLPEPPITCVHYSGGVNYKSMFFLAVLQNADFQPRMNYNSSQITEVIDIRWFNIEQIRTDAKRMYPALSKAFKLLRKKYKIRRLLPAGLLNERPIRLLRLHKEAE